MKKRSHRAHDALKRCLDVLGAALLLVALSPVLAVVALVVAIDLGSPVLFRQPRAGRHGRAFTLLKFRTMRPAPEGAGTLEAAASDAERLTPVGRFLRSSSLDEWPQLVNVLRGEMSFIGPRPLLVDYLDRYNAEQARRHDVRPGITGWAQVNGRNTTSWPERLAMDVWYVDNRSFALDARIVARTFGTVLGRSGVSAAGEATMTEFTGEGAGETASPPHGSA